MILSLRRIMQDHLVKQMLTISLLLLVGISISILWSWKSFPPQVPIFYSLPKGEEQLSSPLALILLPLTILCGVAATIIIGITTYRRYPFLTQLLSIATCISTILISIAYYNIMTLIF